MKRFWLLFALAYVLAIMSVVLIDRPAKSGVTCAVPFNLTNGTIADASQVMANYNAILSCLANNTAASGANSDITSLTGLVNAGTWSPTLIGHAGGGWTVTSSGNYEKIGQQVTARFSISASSANAPLGDIEIGGLPVMSSNTVGGCFFFNQSGYTNSAGYTSFAAQVLQNSNVAILFELGSGQTSILAVVARAAAMNSITGVCSYESS